MPLDPHTTHLCDALDINNDITERDIDRSIYTLPSAVRGPAKKVAVSCLRLDAMVEQTSGDDGNEHQAILDSSSCEPVTIHLEYMCSTCTYGRRLFGHETLADREEGMSILRRKLNNQVVSKNSISFIPLGFSDDIDLYTDGVFFMVSEAEAQGKPLHDKQCINLKPDSFRVTLVERSTAHEKDSSIEVAEGSEEEYICPGYESTLQELLTMAQTRDQRCSPTAVVISGCPGVGKTRMVRPRSNLIAQSSLSI